MATTAQIRGMLLEEALLYLLRLSGYRTVEKADEDLTLNNGHSGLEVFGRGGVHQIDAVADFVIAQPFSNPQRLLLEAKFRSDKTGIEVVRNAVGVLKDVSEYWVSRKEIPFKARYHYQYAVFSISDYTSPAQKYAFAHDVYLIPLNSYVFFRPVIQAIETVTVDYFKEKIYKKLLKNLRFFVQNKLKYIYTRTPDNLLKNDFLESAINDFINECHRLNGALLAMIDRQFPVFIVPNHNINVRNLEDFIQVEISWDDQGRYIKQLNSNLRVFSFDLPKELFNLYAKQGFLSNIEALNLKSDYMSEIQALVTSDNQTRVITLQLDQQWLNNLHETFNTK
ncbi:restriction endonuclease [Nostoc sp. XA010]|uniref:restriction endonuclease n=1 Tax=Nostoc sp. XA010 TaxID=2780407 RepID=UPI001E3649B8|nr:restriction endonuclease [Nostoc sp. XA010]MCC5657158.1 restriction endonuclease [Nostoc sp. XA010]